LFMIIGIDASRANRCYKTGTEWYSYYLIKGLSEIDNKNTYWLYSNTPLIDGLDEIVKTKKNFKAKILKWPFCGFWTLGRLSLEMLKFWARPDVLFIPAHSLPFFFPKKTLNTVHDIAFTQEGASYDYPKFFQKNKIIGRLFAGYLKLHFLLKRRQIKSLSTDYIDWSTESALLHSKKIITVSEQTKKEIIATYKTDPAKIEVVHNGYNDVLYKKVSDSAAMSKVLEKYGLTSGFMLYVGRLEKKKNIAAMIEAFALLREKHPEIKIKLVLVGMAGYGYDEIKYTVEEYNLNSEISALGWVPEDDMPYIYNAARVFVFPSHHEGFGIPVIQALACGVPAVVSDIPVFREVTGECALFFDKDDKNDMAEKMFMALSDENLRQKMITTGYERVKNFSWKKCAAETLAVIEKM